MKKAILKSSGRTYFVKEGRECGTKEENEAKAAAGKIYWRPGAYGRTAHCCWIDRNGECFGRVYTFFADQLQFID